MSAWILIAPEYPPKVGGIADYVAALGTELVRAGDEVEVFAPAPAAPAPGSGSVVHELPRGFEARAFREMAELARARPQAVTVLQYLPMTFGHPRALRFLLAWPGPLWIMFHESAYPFEAGQRFRHRVLAVGTHLAAHALVRRAERVLVSTPGCEGALEKFGRSPLPAVWLPIPSNLCRAERPRERAEVLREFGLEPEAPVVGHFSAFGDRVAETLRQALAHLLRADARVQVLLAGQGSDGFAERLAGEVPTAAARIRAAGRVSSARAGEAIDASDVLLFPYPDGISTRRTTAMAGLAFGKPLVTTLGANTEAVWQREACVELCSLEPRELSERVRALLADPARRAALGSRAERVYRSRFALERVVETLRGLRVSAER